MQTMVDAPAFDFIKLDIEGEEMNILQDPASREVLCAAVCVFVELHEGFKAGTKQAWTEFVSIGCEEGHRMRELASNGQLSIACREDF